MSRQERKCVLCGQDGHNSNTCPRQCCGRCVHAAREAITSFDMVPCTQNLYPLRHAKTYPAHAACDKASFLPRPRKQPQPPKDKNEQQPTLI